MSSLVHLGRSAVARPDRDTGKELARRSVVHGRRTVADVMTRFPATVRQDASLWSAWDRMHRSRSRHLVVVDDRRRPVGVLDDRTVALEWPAGPMAPHRIPASRLIGQQAPPPVRGGVDLATAARALLAADADALPVVDRDGRLFGLLTTRHCVEVVADVVADVVAEALSDGRA